MCTDCEKAKETLSTMFIAFCMLSEVVKTEVSGCDNPTTFSLPRRLTFMRSSGFLLQVKSKYFLQ